MNGLD